MKIHIVQKGDTLWEIAKKYGVDFEELKQVNSHLSSPDMIMPGMKIKIPSSSKPVKKETKKPTQKEVIKEKPKAVHPYQPITEKPTKVSKEQPIMEQPVKEQPIFKVPPMPILDYDMPDIPKVEPKKEVKEEKKKEAPKKVVKEKKKEDKKPVKKPEAPPVQESPEVLPEYMPAPVMPMMPMCHYVHPCCYHIFHPYMPVPMGGMYQPMPYQPIQPAHVHGWQQMPMQQAPIGDCGCQGQSYQMPMTYGMHDMRDDVEQEQQSEQPEVFPLPQDLNPPHYMSHPLYPYPPIGGPPSFAELRDDADEEEQKSDE